MVLLNGFTATSFGAAGGFGSSAFGAANATGGLFGAAQNKPGYVFLLAIWTFLDWCNLMRAIKKIIIIIKIGNPIIVGYCSVNVVNVT